jgi:16S rRNA (uracil1498-N3)-methyltransferase
MPRRRFFVSSDRIRNGIAVLNSDQVHHLRDVLRLHAGEEVELFDGEGCGYRGKVECRGPKIHIVSLTPLDSRQESGGSLLLATALIRPERFDWVLQKATELGVNEFIPLETRFTNVRIPPARLEARIERWQRITREAAKQCRRLTVPRIRKPIPFASLLSLQDFGGCARFLLHEKAPERLEPPLPAGGSMLLCVGPEGGWDDAEAASAENAGYQLVNLGSRILRAETAAVSAVAIFQFLRDSGSVTPGTADTGA